MGLTQRPGQTASTLATVGTRWVHPQHSVLRTPKWFRTVMPQTACAAAAIWFCRDPLVPITRPCPRSPSSRRREHRVPWPESPDRVERRVRGIVDSLLGPGELGNLRLEWVTPTATVWIATRTPIWRRNSVTG